MATKDRVPRFALIDGLSESQRNALARAFGRIWHEAEVRHSRSAASAIRELTAAFCRPTTQDERNRYKALTLRVAAKNPDLYPGGVEFV